MVKSWKLFWDCGLLTGRNCADDDPVAAGGGEHDGLGDLSVGSDVAVVVLDVAVVVAQMIRSTPACGSQHFLYAVSGLPEGCWIVNESSVLWPA